MSIMLKAPSATVDYTVKTSNTIWSANENSNEYRTQMAQKPMLRAEVYARASRASQNVKGAEVWAFHDLMIGYLQISLWKIMGIRSIFSPYYA
jgi:hypothetical protein